MITAPKKLTSKQKRELLAQKFTSPGYTNWQKLASVTPGGKPFFYYRTTPSCVRPGRIRQWIVWDRQLEAWTYKCEYEALVDLTA